MKTLFFIFFFLFGLVQAQNLLIQNIKNPLAKQIFWDAVQDKEQNWYFATNQGVVVYNGLNYYLIPTVNPLRKIILEEGSKIWAGGKKEFGYVDLKTKNKFHSLLGSLQAKDQENFGQVFDMRFTQGTVQILSDKFLISIGTQNLGIIVNKLPEEFSGSGLLGNQWILTGTESLFDLGISSIKKFETTELIQNLGIYKTEKLSENQSIIATNNDKLILWESGKTTELKHLDAITSVGKIYNLTVTKKGLIAVSTYSKGILILDASGKLINHLTNIPSQEIYMLKGWDDGFWVGFSNGLHYISNSESIINYGVNAGKISDFIEFENKKYFTSSTGLYENDKIVTGFTGVECWQLAIDGDRLLIASSNGLYSLKAGKLTNLIERKAIFSIISEQGKVFYAGENSAGLVSGDSISNDIKSLQMEANSYVHDGKQAWIGTNYNGLLKITNGKIEYLKQKENSLSRTVRVLNHQNNILFFTSTGVFRFVNEKLEKVKGLEEVQNNVTQMIKTQDNLICFLIDNYVQVYQFSDNQYVYKPELSVSLIENIQAFALNDKGIFLTNATQYLFLPKNSENSQPNILLSQAISKDSVLFASLKTELATVYLSAGEDLKLRPALQNFKRPSDKLMWYRLKKDQDWKKFDGEIVVSALSWGQYELEIKIYGTEGVFIQKKIADIYVSAPFWLSLPGLSIIGFILILLIYLINKFNSRRLEKRNQELDHLVTERTTELATANQDLKKLASNLEEANLEITDSIRYASRIQLAILPDKEIPLKLFKNFDLWFQPKDVLSGDFYWFFSNEKYLYIAAADCTGHGVPGALMSVMGVNFLNSIISSNAYASPEQILTELDVHVRSAIQKSVENKVQDGMDIALVRIDLQTKELVFSGAFRPILILRKGEILSYVASRTSIAGLIQEKFEATSINLETNDRLIMYSDGITDQFGGEKEKKFGVKSLKDILLNTSGKSANDTIKEVKVALEKWKENTSQTDDILIIVADV